MHRIIHRLKKHFSADGFIMRWLQDTKRMRKLVRDFDANTLPAGNSKQFAVVIMPWCGSAVPWFSLACGLLLAERGHKLTFILDDLPYGFANQGWKYQLSCIKSVLRLLQGRHRIIKVSDHLAQAPLRESAQYAIERLAALNGVWAQRGELNVSTQYVEMIKHQLSTCHGAIEKIIRTQSFDMLFVPGGVYASSGLWFELAHAVGIRVGSYDSGGYGMLLLAADGIACQLRDIPRAYAALKAPTISAAEQEFIISSALAEIGKRRTGIDKFSSQLQKTQPLDTRYNGAVMIALNSPWDSAALGLHTVFETTHEWLVATVRHLLENTSVPVVVRQHPAERLPIARSNDDYRKLLLECFGEHPRLHFIAAQDPINSYELLEQVAAVVIYTSTMGVEAAAHGKTVITESSSYYADLGFVHKADNLQEYERLLYAAVSGHLTVSPAMRRDALICYYATQCCNWIFTPFNVPDFPKWSRRSLRELSNENSIKLIIKALAENTPASILNHREQWRRHCQDAGEPKTSLEPCA